MPKERDTSHAVVKTYVTTSKTRTGKTVYHARIVSSSGRFDHRGSGKTWTEAVARARAKK